MPIQWHQHSTIIRQESNFKRCVSHLKNHQIETLSTQQWHDLTAEILYVAYSELSQSAELNFNRGNNPTILSQTNCDHLAQALLARTIPSSLLCKIFIKNKNQLLSTQQIS